MSDKDSDGQKHNIPTAAESAIMCNTKLRDEVPMNQKAVIDVQSPLSVQFQNYHLHSSSSILIILAIIIIISSVETAIQVSIHCRLSTFGRSGSSTSSLVVNHYKCALSRRGCAGCRPCSMGSLDVFQPTSAHGWTKLIAQSSIRLS
jgi:hypothetical protein